MVGFGESDVLWYVVAAVAAGFALAFVAGVRRFARWCGRKAKAGYLGWFQEAVDEHLEPQFVAMRLQTVASAEKVRADAFRAAEVLRAETDATTEELRAETAATAATVRDELRRHTEAEGELVRAIVHEALAPIIATMTEAQAVVGAHIDHDERTMQPALAALEVGQQTLLDQMVAIETKLENP